MDFPLHLAPNAPWPWFVLLTLAFFVLAHWAYRIALPPLPAFARRVLTGLRLVALALLLWLLAQPVLERALGSGGRVVVLLDRSQSMDLPVRPGGPTRRAEAEQAAEQLRRAWRGRAEVEVRPFARGLLADSAAAGATGATAPGDALLGLGGGGAPAPGAVVVVSDGVVNAGEDPVAAARALGVPVHVVGIGGAPLPDRAMTGVESSAQAQVGRSIPVRATLTSTEPAGQPVTVRLFDGAREIGRTNVTSPGSGAEITAEFRVTPDRPGLAVWTARVDSLAGEAAPGNDARQVAVEVAPGRLGVLAVSGGLNWDFAFLMRALSGDSALAVTRWVRGRDGWSAQGAARAAAPGPEQLRGQAVVVLDAIAPPEVSPAFDRALGEFVRSGGAVIALGGELPGISRYRAGALADLLRFDLDPAAITAAASPQPVPATREWVAWDDDPARAERAWRTAAPLSGVVPIAAGGADRVLLASAGQGPPLMLVRRAGRGQLLVVNGTGFWRWSLSGLDELTAERGRRLWRGLVRALAEPVQGEPLRVRPERWLTARGEAVRLLATAQDEQFQPVSGAEVEGTLTDARGRTRAVRFRARSAGSYEAEIPDLPPGRHRVSARATKGGRELGRATTDLAVDAWSLEAARTAPDTAALASLARATGGSVAPPGGTAAWARGLEARALARPRTESLRLWESPWLFALVVGLLSVEWAWRRRRGLP